MNTLPKALLRAADFARSISPRDETHRLAVGSRVLDRTGDVELAIAAALHDVAERAMDEQIVRSVEHAFGRRVARVVAVCSENGAHPEPPFRDLDEVRVAELFCATRDSLIVAAADALCAVEAASAAWTSGTSPRVIEASVWFWRELAAVIDDRLRGWSLGRDLRDAVAALDHATRHLTSPAALPVAG